VRAGSKYDEAIQAYDKAIELNPQFATPWYNKGLALKELGLITDANKVFSKAKELGYNG
jgi:tetratricopeptide (TPR) repeat protein